MCTSPAFWYALHKLLILDFRRCSNVNSGRKCSYLRLCSLSFSKLLPILILVETLIKTDHVSDIAKHEKILFGPDNKIGSNLLKLREHNRRYEHFLPEFTLLHLRFAFPFSINCWNRSSHLDPTILFVRKSSLKASTSCRESDHLKCAISTRTWKHYCLQRHIKEAA
jgi:hypothetical protein